MRSKSLLTTTLAIVLVLTSTAYAVNQNSDNGTGNEVQQQTQTGNQGTDSQIQTQNNEQTQAGNGAGEQVQNQNQIENQGSTNQIQNAEQEETQSENGEPSETAIQRRSQVANAVQEMLQVADRSGEIGQQVKTIAQTQTQNQEKLETSLQKVENRNKFVKFFIGPDYGEINGAKRTLEQNREQVRQLNRVREQLINEGDRQILTEQIQTLEQANLGIENELNESQKGFSLLGWLFKFLAK